MEEIPYWAYSKIDLILILSINVLTIIYINLKQLHYETI